LKMGRKRRGSQAFTFEQSEETLLQNENIVKLYQNKTFEPPEPQELETIREEGALASAKRTKRGETEDGSLVLGVSKSRRIIVDYKFWKQDDKEKNRRRKLKIAKQWKGRKRNKTKPLNYHLEQQLIDLIADRVSSDEEDGLEDCEVNQNYMSSQCIWEASNVLSSSNHEEMSLSSECKADQGNLSESNQSSQCVWEASSVLLSSKSKELTMSSESEADQAQPECFSEGDTSLSDITNSRSKPPSAREHLTSRNNQPSEDLTNENDVLNELQGLIPESELEELLQCDDFLFCSSKENRTKTGPPAKADSKTRENKDRRSVRRSARIMSVPNLTGSIFTGPQMESGDEENLDPREEKKRRKEKPKEGQLQVSRKKRTKRCTPHTAQGSKKSQEGVREVFKDVSNHKEEPASNTESSEMSKRASEESGDAVKSKRRKSYSLEDGRVRYSLDGSRRNSVLTLSGEREINISMPDSVRRSLSVADSNLHMRYLPTPSPLPFESDQKFSMPGRGLISSDDEEEEVVISGNLRKKTKKTFMIKPTRKVQ